MVSQGCVYWGHGPGRTRLSFSSNGREQLEDCITMRSRCTKPLLALVLLVGRTVWAQKPGQSHSSGGGIAIGDVGIAQLRFEVAQMKPGPEHDYLAGVLAAREGRDDDASRLFTQALLWLRRAEPDRAALALRLLANVYDREGLYGRSEPLYSELERSGGMNRLPESYRSGAHDDAELARVLANSPAQTLTWDGPVHLVTSRNNPLGLITTELTVNGVKSEWVLDTGANQSVVSRSFASQLHLAMLPGVAHTSGGITGTENALRVAVLPSLPLGGATVHDVPLLVLEDANLTIPNGKGQPYRIAGIIGFPVIRALGRITFHHAGMLDATAGGNADDGEPMELRLLNPVVEVGVEGQGLPFTLDTGAAGTTLSVRFYQRFKAEEQQWKTSETKNFGAGGETTSHSFIVRSMPITVGGRALMLHELAVFPVEQHADIDALFGNMGEDVLQSAQSFTLDFKHMRFVLGAPLPGPARTEAGKK